MSESYNYSDYSQAKRGGSSVRGQEREIPMAYTTDYYPSFLSSQSPYVSGPQDYSLDFGHEAALGYSTEMMWQGETVAGQMTPFDPLTPIPGNWLMPPRSTFNGVTPTQAESLQNPSAPSSTQRPKHEISLDDDTQQILWCACGVQFRGQRKNRTANWRRHANTPETKDYGCGYCSYKSSRKDNVKSHIKSLCPNAPARRR